MDLAAENIAIDLVFAQSNASVIQQLAANSINVSVGSGLVDPIRAVDKGAPVALIRIETQKPPYALLARPAIEINAAQILDALEGPMALTECASAESHCCIESSCLVGRAWQRVNLAIRRSLQEITLLELAGLSGSSNQPSALDRGIPVALGSIASRTLKREAL